MTVEIICPHCNFTKEMPEEKIPRGVRWATCPRCEHRFEFTLREPSFDFEQDVSSISQGDFKRGPSPWENRSDLGFWQGLYKTFKAVLFSPQQLFKNMHVDRGMREPLAFGLLFGSIGTMMGSFWQFLMMWHHLPSLGQGLLGGLSIHLLFLGIMILIPFFVFLNILITSAILHVCLLIVRGGTNGFEGTFSVIAYSQATQILGLIPVLGGIAGWFWHPIVQFIGIREIHDTTYLRVVMAFIIPLALIIFLILAFLIPFLIFF